MTFIARTSAPVFQSPSATKPIALGHQPLHRQPRQLCQPMQILKGGRESLELTLRQKCPQSQFDPRRLPQRWPHRRRSSRNFGRNHVTCLRIRDQPVDFLFAGRR